MDWPFFRIALLVTGKGEEKFLPTLFGPLMEEGHCAFIVEHRIPQLNPVTSERRRREMVGSGKVISTLDEEIGLKARRCFERGFNYVIIVDDLEHDRRDHLGAIFQRYRMAIDTMLARDGLDHLVSVHFLVNMMEAYYFANAAVINNVLGTRLPDYEGDVEEIRHPKNQLKDLSPGFDEIEHGEQIMQQLDVKHVLSNPKTCKSLRSLFGWCSRAIGRPFDEAYQLKDGAYWDVTREQIDRLPNAPSETEST